MSSLQPGANKANVIKGQISDKDYSVYNFVISIRDGLAVFKCENNGFTKRLYNAEKKIYGDDVVLLPTGEMLQKYPGVKAEDISKDLLIKLRKAKVNITKK